MGISSGPMTYDRLDALIVVARDEQFLFFPWKLSKGGTIGGLFSGLDHPPTQAFFVNLPSLNYPMVPPLDNFQGKNKNGSSLAGTISASSWNFFANLTTFERQSGKVVKWKGSMIFGNWDGNWCSRGPLLVHYLLLTCSWLVHDLFMSCLQLVHYSFTTCS